MATSQHPARRVAAGSQKSAAGSGTRIFDERSGPGDVSGSPGAGRQADPAASNEGSSLGNK